MRFIVAALVLGLTSVDASVPDGKSVSFHCPTPCLVFNLPCLIIPNHLCDGDSFFVVTMSDR